MLRAPPETLAKPTGKGKGQLVLPTKQVHVTDVALSAVGVVGVSATPPLGIEVVLCSDSIGQGMSGEIVLGDVFCAELHVSLLELRDLVYWVRASWVSKNARKRHLAYTKAVFRRWQVLAHAMPPESASILAEIQLAMA